MSKIDCSNIFNFLNEWKRRYEWEQIENPEVKHKKFPNLEQCNVRIVVDMLQRWSDEHPKVTRREKFMQICKENGFGEEVRIRMNEVSCGYPMCVGDCCMCEKHWNEVVDEI